MDNLYHFKLKFSMGSTVLKPFEHVYNKDRPIFKAIRQNKFSLAKKLKLSRTDVDCINNISELH